MEHRLSLFWPLSLIAAGALWILIELGTVPVSSLWALVFLWPFLLIAAGLGLILRPYWRYSSPLMSVLVVCGAFAAVLLAPQLGWNRVPAYALGSGPFFAGASERGSGNVVTKSREVHDFTAIHITYPAQVVIQQGSSEALTIKAEDNVAASIDTQVVNHVLEIGSLHDFIGGVNPTKPVQITITVKDLSDLEFEAAGEVRVDGLKTDKFRTEMDGAGTLSLDKLEVKSLDSNLNGVGSIRVNGVADDLTVRVNGLGDFNGGELRAHSANVNLQGLGSAMVWADEVLNATVGGMGSVSYYGNAKVSKNIGGLGTVNYLGTK